MLWLLNPRVWLAAAIAAVLIFTHYTSYKAGKNNVTLQWKAAVAQANTESRQLEQQRQRRADEASALSAKRSAVLSADAARAGDALSKLRSAVAARSVAEESLAAATLRADTNGKLLIESAEALRGLAATCDRHVNDVQKLLDSWPK